jgi:hypothetical protein
MMLAAIERVWLAACRGVWLRGDLADGQSFSIHLSADKTTASNMHARLLKQVLQQFPFRIGWD